MCVPSATQKTAQNCRILNNFPKHGAVAPPLIPMPSSHQTPALSDSLSWNGSFGVVIWLNEVSKVWKLWVKSAILAHCAVYSVKKHSKQHGTTGYQKWSKHMLQTAIRLEIPHFRGQDVRIYQNPWRKPPGYGKGVVPLPPGGTSGGTTRAFKNMIFWSNQPIFRLFFKFLRKTVVY